MRLTPRDPAEADTARLREAIVTSRPGLAAAGDLVDAAGHLQGPFACLPYSADVGDALQKVGVALRSSTVTSRPVSEAVILTVACWWRAEYEWHVHEALVRVAGLLSADQVQLIATGACPAASDVAAAVGLARSVLAGAVSENHYREAVDALGEEAAVEVVMTVGYYTALAMLITAFQPPTPANGTYPWKHR